MSCVELKTMRAAHPFSGVRAISGYNLTSISMQPLQKRCARQKLMTRNAAQEGCALRARQRESLSPINGDSHPGHPPAWQEQEENP